MAEDKRKEIDVTVIEVTEEYLKEKLYKIRGKRVLLDADLAEIYGYDTKGFNRQVKNNIEKFDEDFMFELTDEELEDLRYKNCTANISSKSRYNPHVFTEQGLYMLMTVLKGPLAVKQSKALIRTFKKMKDYILEKYVSVACHKFDSPPYVCNNCKDKKLCNKDKYIYSAKFADAAVTRRRSESRQGIRISDEKKEELDELVTRLVKKGQPLTHIYAEHENEMPVCLRTLYNYIDEGALTIKNIDLRRKTGYKPRKKKYNDINGFHSMEFRQGRMYEDFEYAMKFKHSEDEVTEMDTVKGVRESGKRLLTMIFRKNNVMLLFLMPDGKAESVKRVFDYLETGLGIDVFRRLFPVILTDNGSEFKKVDELELTPDKDRPFTEFCSLEAVMDLLFLYHQGLITLRMYSRKQE